MLSSPAIESCVSEATARSLNLTQPGHGFQRPPAQPCKNYQEFLQTRFWLDLRDSVISLRHFRSERCNRKNRLQAHHKAYRQSWFDTKIEDLEVLCAFCHAVEHNKRFNPPLIKKAKRSKSIRNKNNGAFRAVRNEWKRLINSGSKENRALGVALKSIYDQRIPCQSKAEALSIAKERINFQQVKSEAFPQRKPLNRGTKAQAAGTPSPARLSAEGFPETPPSDPGSMSDLNDKPTYAKAGENPTPSGDGRTYQRGYGATGITPGSIEKLLATPCR